MHLEGGGIGYDLHMECMCGCGGSASGKSKWIRGHNARRPTQSQLLPDTNPSGLCNCGCGEKTSLATQTITARGAVKGRPVMFIRGHGTRVLLREKSSQWKGGRIINKDGYVLLRKPVGYPANGRYVFQHRLVMEKRLGRYLLPGENVHHKNGQRADNRDENLELWASTQPSGVRVSDYHCPGCNCG